MLITPVSRLNISCPCTECNTFLRPLRKDVPPLRLPPDLLPSALGLGFSLPPTPAATPIPTRKCTPHATPRLRPTVPTLAPSPAFLLTRSSFSSSKSKKGKAGGPLALPSLSLSPTSSKRVTFASRSLWANTSSPIVETNTLLSAKTPGLATCAQESCLGKVVPGFGRTVCNTCEDELRGAVLGLATLLEDESLEKLQRARLSRNESLIVCSAENVDVQAVASDNEPCSHSRSRSEGSTEPSLFAIPTTPPSTKLLLTHSLSSTPRQSAEEASPPLFALPNTSLERTYETFTPTTKYAMDFPALPASSRASKRSSREDPELARSMSNVGEKAGIKNGSQAGSTAASKRNSTQGGRY